MRIALDCDNVSTRPSLKRSTSVGTFPTHHSTHRDPTGQGSHQDRHQQGPQGHYGWKDAGFGQDQDTAGKGHRRGGAGTAIRTVGLLGGILTYAVEAGIIESNPTHGIRKPKDNVLSEAEYRILGRMLRDAAKQEKYATMVDIVQSVNTDRLPTWRDDPPEMDGSRH
jgi:hypothetical protein